MSSIVGLLVANPPYPVATLSNPRRRMNRRIASTAIERFDALRDQRLTVVGFEPSRAGRRCRNPRLSSCGGYTKFTAVLTLFMRALSGAVKHELLFTFQ
jgi:hypothetical protein